MALGRKNWLFVANENGGKMAAVINSLVVTCKDNKVDFEAWLAGILPRLRELNLCEVALALFCYFCGEAAYVVQTLVCVLREL